MTALDMLYLFSEIDLEDHQHYEGEESAKPAPEDKGYGGGGIEDDLLYKYGFNGCQDHCHDSVLYLLVLK